MNRLDNVLGPENWWDEYVPGENSVLCRLTVRLPDGSTLTKADAGGYAGMADSGRRRQERLLRRLQAGRREVRRRPLPLSRRRPHLRPRARAGRRAVAARAGRGRGRGAPAAPAAAPTPALRRLGNGNGHGSARPGSGRALFAWTKDQEQRHEVGLLKYLNSWAKLQDFPGRMVDWDADQVEPGLRRGLPQAPVDLERARRGLRGSPGELRALASLSAVLKRP